MTIPPDLEAQILRYYHVEKWRVGTIARQLHVHHGTVARVLSQAGLPRIGPPARRSQVEPYTGCGYSSGSLMPWLKIFMGEFWDRKFAELVI
jgi:hypothetical protein